MTLLPHTKPLTIQHRYLMTQLCDECSTEPLQRERTASGKAAAYNLMRIARLVLSSRMKPPGSSRGHLVPADQIPSSILLV